VGSAIPDLAVPPITSAVYAEAKTSVSICDTLRYPSASSL
jgi:hypothetical protein